MKRETHWSKTLSHFTPPVPCLRAELSVSEWNPSFELIESDRITVQPALCFPATASVATSCSPVRTNCEKSLHPYAAASLKQVVKSNPAGILLLSIYKIHVSVLVILTENRVLKVAKSSKCFSRLFIMSSFVSPAFQTLILTSQPALR